MLSVLIGALCIGASIAIVAILAGDDWNATAEHVGGTLVALTLYSAAGLTAVRLGDRRPQLGAMASGALAMFGLGLLALLIAIWFGHAADATWRSAGVLLILSAGTAHASLLLGGARPQEPRPTTLVRGATIVAGCALSLVFAGVVAADSIARAMNWRAVAVVAILFALGNVLLPLVKRLPNGG